MDAVDVIVVGCGAAGFTAALAAHERGASVLMLEKAEQVGGTTRKAGVWIWVPDNPYLRADGLQDPRPAALRYMAKLARPHVYDQAGLAVELLGRVGALRPHHRPDIPDYYAEIAEDETPYGRVIMPEPRSRPTGGTGFEFAEALDRAARAHGIPIRTSCRAVAVQMEGERVVGVVADEGGTERVFRARGGVVFASGGFTHNRELMLRSFSFPLVHGAAAPSNEGDFVAIAAAAGARLGNMGNAWLAPIQLEQALTPDDARTNASITEMHGDSMVVVNRDGRRVVNEKAMYNDFTQAFFEWDGVAGEYPNLRLFLIYDAATARIFGDDASGNPILPPDADASHVLTAATIPELAIALQQRLVQLGAASGGIRLADRFTTELRRTIEQFNDYAEAGADPDFRRGEKAIELFFNGPGRPGNDRSQTMYPFDPEGPYHAIILTPGTLDTKGGPVIDACARVVGADGRPIPGLYGAGNCIASPSAQAYWAGGATVGLAITFGRIAGVQAAEAAAPGATRT
jgi:succinate dehydrogenase/fumarate reductase flavoprotein subunit